ncbi:hypothetical protein E3N88_02050 [Mikania micrantha]|uniref:CSD domain-containing protein n=1 Tax=Mikania micrantha TaxID=192012 RepID=A0A5N6Q2R0_9ASTR|nr:hypothetical protein E3N88_02050 [Mikania micrantha]
MAADGDRKSGTVKWFNDTKGFGFITPEDGGEELFVHQSSIRTDGFRSLGDGEAVEYLIEQGSDGRTKAADVTGPNEGGGGGRYGGRGGGGGGGYGAYPPLHICQWHNPTPLLSLSSSSSPTAQVQNATITDNGFEDDRLLAAAAVVITEGDGRGARVNDE